MLNQAEAAKALAEAGKTAGPEYNKATWEAKNLEIENRIKTITEGREAPQRRSDTKVTNNNISVSVNAPGGDPAQVRRSGAAVAREVSNAVAMSGRYR